MGVPCLNIQVNIFPLFNGGLYVTVGQGSLNRMIRVGLLFIDLRLWLQGFERGPSPALRMPPGEGGNLPGFVPVLPNPAAVFFPPGMLAGAAELNVWRCPTCDVGFAGGPPPGAKDALSL